MWLIVGVIPGLNHGESHKLYPAVPVIVSFAYSFSPMDYARLASQLVRELRGPRTQREVSEALGYRSNVVSAWETGRDIPPLQTFFRFLLVCGQEPLTLLSSFRELPADFDHSCRRDIGRFIEGLRGSRSLVDIASEVRMDRYLLSRVISGRSDPRLHDFLELIDVLTLAVTDLVSLLVDPVRLAEIAARAQQERNARVAAARFPWAQAVLLLATLPEYQCLARHPTGWFASKLGRTVSEEKECLQMLVELGRLSHCGGRYLPADPAIAVDTRLDAKLTRRQASFWLREAAARGESDREVRLGFNVFGVSRTDLARLREVQDRYFAEMRSIISKSEPTEVAAVTLFSTFVL